MAYSYFTKELLGKSDFDLANVFPEKQEVAKTNLNTSYSLPEIAMYIKDGTNNFKNSDNYFIDLDIALRRLMDKYFATTNIKNPFLEEEEDDEDYSQTRTPAEVTAQGIKSGKPDSRTKAKTTASVVNKVDEDIASTQEAIDYLKDEAEAGDEDSIEALAYLQEALEELLASVSN